MYRIPLSKTHALQTRLTGILIATLLCSPAAGTPPNDPQLPARYSEQVRSASGEAISFEMVLIRGGSFPMGSPADEAGRKEDEGPVHQVSVSPFYLATTETTMELFMIFYRETVTAARPEAYGSTSNDDVDAVSGPTPVYGDMTMGRNTRHPAIGMTWKNALLFCKWLSEKTGEKYRLPTEAEWEYACRAGSTAGFGPAGDLSGLEESAWFAANSRGRPHEVGSKPPNPWGLQDMQGNVREWVFDFYDPATYSQAPSGGLWQNPNGPEAGRVHVARGGDYRSPAPALRCAARDYEQRWWRSGDPQMPKSKWWLPNMDIIGLRVARSVD